MPEPTQPQAQSQTQGPVLVPLPRVAIRFCVQCKWNLRAAYYAQELLQTFSRSLGEVALIPSTAGTFIITLALPSIPQQPQLQPDAQSDRDLATILSPAEAESTARQLNPHQSGVEGIRVLEHVLWDRQTDTGFPETKELKRRVRDLVEPGRGLGHVDRDRDQKITKRREDGVDEGEQKGDEEEMGAGVVSKERDGKGKDSPAGGGEDPSGGRDAKGKKHDSEKLETCEDCG